MRPASTSWRKVLERYPVARIAEREALIMPGHAAELARRLAREAEAVCRHYLSNGRREGRYWLVGDVSNTPGRSMFVRLSGPETGKGAAGKWTDAATGEHGDLLDVIRESLRARSTSATSPTKRGASSACRDRNRTRDRSRV